MYKVKTLNQIALKGLNKFSRDTYELSGEFQDPDAILVRSHELTMEDATTSLRAVGRAGAGVNNIPVGEYTKKGIVVFNTPGANANAVKELVMAALLLSVRSIVEGMNYVNALKGINDHDEMNRLVEAEKKRFKGTEVAGKTIGVLGLGAIGSMVADMALQMGMQVLGYDPALSVEAAWRLSSRVQKMENMQSLFARADVVTLHVPVLDSTRNMINSESLAYFKRGVTLLNFAREEIVNASDLRAAMLDGKVAKYFSDFPTPELMGVSGVSTTPHLGASTGEAEENCAVMVAEQVIDFLDNGNIRNSVNFPTVYLERTTGLRLALANHNVPRILGSVLSILADRDINIIDMLNKSRDDIAYNLIDMEAPSHLKDAQYDGKLLAEILAIDGVINVRTIAASA